MMSRGLLGAVCVLSLGLLACGTRPSVSSCNQGFDGSFDGGVDGSVSRVWAAPAWSRSARDDAGVSVPLDISAQIPCLIGGVTATVTSSVGTVGGMSPGSAASVFLAPTTPDRLAGILEGETTLAIPAGRSSRIEVRVADSDVFTLISDADASTESHPAVATDASTDTRSVLDGAAGD
jgi:hypothetical protein